MQEVEGKEEDRVGQVEVEEEKRHEEVRSWMTMEMKQDSDLEFWAKSACETTSQGVRDCALSVHANVMCVFNVFTSLHLLLIL